MKNISISAALVALAATLASSTAFAAPTAELKVTGVIKPTACTPTIGGSGVVDYGDIPASTLNKSSPTKLAAKIVPFSLACEAAIKVALKFTDNKASTKVSGLGTTVSANTHEEYMMGLGTANGKKIGAYRVAIKQSSYTADSTAVDTIYSADQGATWARPESGSFNSSNLISWGATNSTKPIAVKAVSGSLEVIAVIDKADNLSLTSDVLLDGGGTIEVVYL